ncbi:bestrophin family protein [Chondromyces crocatus]|uniref:Bestrophin n=1 Tax=Chondromyces crocatus TaxID=52 RepID=A0A0K1ET75_CHOCO|nr:bestrophin family protein [Chondromyces crocatus]AKT43852.1 uncharacterized protein CMC5_080890 [Chondromyces crocatus]
MIVRERPSFWRLFLILRGSVVPRILPQIGATMVLSCLVVYWTMDPARTPISITPAPFTLIGLALAIFLGFRNNAAYDRYWEARKLWGELVIVSRSFAREVLTLMSLDADADVLRARQVRLVRKAIAFVHALKDHLRGIKDREGMEPSLASTHTSEEIDAFLRSSNVPNAMVTSLGADLLACRREGLVSEILLLHLDARLNGFTHVQAACERIKTTPIPFVYSLLLHRTAYLYCFLLPFGLVESIGRMTPLVVGLVSYTFFGLDAVGDEIEEPFGLAPNDLPLSAMARTIEINLLEALGEEVLPAPMLPVDYNLE